MSREEHYSEDGFPRKCPSCGGTEFEEKIRDYLDVGVGAGGLPLEIEYLCRSCGESVAYWAHGSFDPAYLKGPL
jgi:hypothetical protein